ncbi:hypothetical protein HY628_01575 [Candidatus Uhrbacteria bacterium]|nr:hypothetical protein [Candidatus Uhrbacteria bacterium]
MFSSIIGHKEVCAFFQKSMAMNRVAHAYLLVGSAKVGKMTVASAFIQALFKKDGLSVSSLESHPDISLIRRAVDEKTGLPKTAISVEQIRGLRERLSFSSLLPSWKVAIIEEAERLTAEAANALLKTLEEPAGKTLIVLLANDLRALPATILSRAQVIRLTRVAHEVLESALADRGATKELAHELATLAAGRPGLALEFLAKPKLLEERRQALAERVKLLSQPLFVRLQWIEMRIKKMKTDQAREELGLWRSLGHELFLGALGVREIVGASQEMISATARLLRRLDRAEESVKHQGDIRLAFEYFLAVA